MSEGTDIAAAPPTKRLVWFRRLRIAASVFFAVLTVALSVLWVRSYWWRDRLEGPLPNSGLFNVWSQQGTLTFLKGNGAGRWKTTSSQIPAGFASASDSWGWDKNAISTQAYFPHWFPLVVVCGIAIVAAMPWNKQRFSLRTLLIATTLVALVLGLVVWAAK